MSRICYYIWYLRRWLKSQVLETRGGRPVLSNRFRPFFLKRFKNPDRFMKPVGPVDHPYLKLSFDLFFLLSLKLHRISVKSANIADWQQLGWGKKCLNSSKFEKFDLLWIFVKCCKYRNSGPGFEFFSDFMVSKVSSTTQDY